MKKIGSRLRDSGGFTLVELLAACVVLILLGLILSAGLSVAAKSYHDVTAESEAQLLLSTLADAVMDDLRFARDLELNGSELVSYTSDSYGLRAADRCGKRTADGGRRRRIRRPAARGLPQRKVPGGGGIPTGGRHACGRLRRGRGAVHPEPEN